MTLSLFDTLFMSLFRYIAPSFCRSFEPLPIKAINIMETHFTNGHFTETARQNWLGCMSVSLRNGRRQTMIHNSCSDPVYEEKGRKSSRLKNRLQNRELWIEIDALSDYPKSTNSLLRLSPTVIIEKRLGSPVDPSDFDIWTPTRHQQSARKEQWQVKQHNEAFTE